MYGSTATGGGATLAFTGSTFNVMWLVAAGFALMAAGFALISLAPKKASVVSS